ncbi:hypothetical protein BDV39DRAFT_207551 [Aspergillus sergii]|uniref:Uncharacterized protein n=1 Tax=Aspergillus sergii TaxID=1034303 RepID=A0A5N6WW11_9EURO|nr:hypothetical protein BDV39DRAFT_207551 [Aspergillus sergii]
MFLAQYNFCPEDPRLESSLFYCCGLGGAAIQATSLLIIAGTQAFHNWESLPYGVTPQQREEAPATLTVCHPPSPDPQVPEEARCVVRPMESVCLGFFHLKNVEAAPAEPDNV